MCPTRHELLPGRIMPTTSALDTALEIIKKFEGCRLMAYRDQVGILTIGYGATGPTITSHSVWTQAQAEANLNLRVQTCIHQASVASPVLVNYPSKLAAIASFIYNLGYGTYINSSHLLPAVNREDWTISAAEIKKFCHAGGVELPGLVRRRELESILLLQ